MIVVCSSLLITYRELGKMGRPGVSIDFKDELEQQKRARATRDVFKGNPLILQSCKSSLDLTMP